MMMNYNQAEALCEHAVLPKIFFTKSDAVGIPLKVIHINPT